MKRAIYTLTAFMLLSVVSVQAQLKLDEAGTVKQIEKLETDSKDSKKGARAGTWIDLAKAYVDVSHIYSTNLFYSMAESAVTTAYGEPQQKSDVNVGGANYQKFSYPNIDIYMEKGTVAFWIAKKDLIPGALDKGVQAYAKAYALDNSAKTEVVVSQGLNRAADVYKQNGSNYYSAEEYAKAADNFFAAFNTLKMPPVEMYDSVSLFNAGYVYVAAGDYAKAIQYLNELLSKGFDNDGEVYFYLIHAYLADGKMDQAKELAKQAMAKYPTNLNIVDVSTSVFIESGEDPTAILPYVRQAVAADPNNAELHAGLGRVLDKLGDIDGAIAEFQKAISLDPDNYAFNFNYALMLIKKADAAVVALRDAPVTSQADMNAKLAEINSMYEKTLVPLEKVHKINPQDKNAVEFLKTIYFRLREQKPEYMQSYEKYDALLKIM